jgi:hypothetical protein
MLEELQSVRIKILMRRDENDLQILFEDNAVQIVLRSIERTAVARGVKQTTREDLMSSLSEREERSSERRW